MNHFVAFIFGLLGMHRYSIFLPTIPYSARGGGIPLFRVVQRLMHHFAILINHQAAILLNDIPLLLVIRARLARDNNMCPMLLRIFMSRRILLPLRAVRILSIEGNPCLRAPVKTRWLLRGMISNSNSNQSLPVRYANIQTIRLGLVPQLLPLQLCDSMQGLSHRLPHLLHGKLLFPASLASAVGQVGDVQRREVLAVCRTLDVCVRGIIE